MSSPYRSFKELADHELEGRGYQIKMNLGDSPVLVMAPHGGKIEPGTTEIAEAIAGQDHSFYSFEGLKTDGNGVLHIESHLFDEPHALKAVAKAKVVVTVHGQINRKDAFVMVGGLNAPLCSEIKSQLKESGFQTRSPIEGLMGSDPKNICNQGNSQRGVQLEISRKVRDSLRTDKDQLQRFADAVRRAIRLYFSSD